MDFCRRRCGHWASLCSFGGGIRERAAVGMDQYLMGESNAFWRREKAVPFTFDPEFGLLEDQRVKIG